MTRLTYLAATACCLILSACRESQETKIRVAESTHWKPGIYLAARKDDGVVLRVVLMSEKKMQFYAGERRLAEHWTQADAPTDVFMAVRDGKLILSGGMVSTQDPLHLGKVAFSSSFPIQKAGVDEIVLGTLEGGVPFGVRLIPTTENEKRAIENHQPVARTNLVTTGAPPEL